MTSFMWYTDQSFKDQLHWESSYCIFALIIQVYILVQKDLKPPCFSKVDQRQIPNAYERRRESLEAEILSLLFLGSDILTTQ